MDRQCAHDCSCIIDSTQSRALVGPFSGSLLEKAQRRLEIRVALAFCKNATMYQEADVCYRAYFNPECLHSESLLKR